MISEIDHIGIAVRSVEETGKFYEDVLGLPVKEILDIPERGIRAAMIDGGNVTIELLEPLRADTPVANFLEKRGEGIHHIAFRVSDIEKALERYKESGVELVTPKPQMGVHGRKVAFLSPKSCHGALIELCEVMRT